MKSKFLFLGFIVIGLSFLSGCTVISNELISELEKGKIETNDRLRINNAHILNTMIQLYTLESEVLPVAKENGNFKVFKLIKNSSDFNQLESTIQSKDPSKYIPVDPLDPERYYEYYSDGNTYSIKAFLEQKTNDCKEIKPNYCEFEIKGNLESILL